VSGVHVQVRLGKERYAVPVEHVVEVGAIGALTATPGGSPAILGVRNLRGDVLPVFDLAAALGLARSDAPQRMLVTERGAERAGFAVDEVTDVDELPEADQETGSDLLSGAVLLDGALVGVIDVDRLFDSLERAA
jgi:chemotaxis signal transduction protein